MKERSMLSLILAVCLIVPAMLVLVACEKKIEEPYGQTFVYGGISLDNYAQINDGADERTLNANLNNINWDECVIEIYGQNEPMKFSKDMITAGKAAATTSGAEGIFQLFKEQADIIFSQTLNGKNITLSDKATSKLTFNGREYSMAEMYRQGKTMYGIQFTEINGDRYGSLNLSYNKKGEIQRLDQLDFMTKNDFSDEVHLDVTFRFNTGSSITITYSPYFVKA